MAHTREMKVKHHIHQPFWDAKAPWTPDQSMHSISGDIADVTAHHMKPAEKYPQVAPGTIVEEPTQQQLIGGGTQRILYRTMSSVSRVVSKRDFVTFQDSFSMANGGHVVYEISVQHRDIPASLPVRPLPLRYAIRDISCVELYPWRSALPRAHCRANRRPSDRVYAHGRDPSRLQGQDA